MTSRHRSASRTSGQAQQVVAQQPLDNLMMPLDNLMMMMTRNGAVLPLQCMCAEDKWCA
jgi:hypothetical protein